MARNRGKPTIREISYAKPTTEEKKLMSAAAIKGEPIVTAILGAAMIELELDNLLRLRFPKITDSTWATMVRENGPFSTFDQKITAGFAFRMFDEATRDNLKIVKNIRNAFAHAKTLIDFEHELVAAEVKKIKIPTFRKRSHRAIQTATGSPKVAYVLLCIVISARLVQKDVIALTAKNRRKRIKGSRQPIGISPLARAFVDSANLQSRSLGPSPLSSLLRRTGDPSSPVLGGLLGELFRVPPENGDKSGK
jgi:hypothetical protein